MFILSVDVNGDSISEGIFRDVESCVDAMLNIMNKYKLTKHRTTYPKCRCMLKEQGLFVTKKEIMEHFTMAYIDLTIAVSRFGLFSQHTIHGIRIDDANILNKNLSIHIDIL
jgi:hypothetical protein